MYRFRSLERIRVDESLVDPSLSPRLNQILVPLLSIIDDELLQEEVRASVKTFDQDLFAERSASAEAGVLEVLAELLEQPERPTVPVSDVTAVFVSRYGQEYERPITNRFVGGILRNDSVSQHTRAMGSTWYRQQRSRKWISYVSGMA